LKVDRDQLFVQVLKDLEIRSTDPGQTEYELLRIGSILRQLLLDQDPLLYQVSRPREVPIRFGVNAFKPPWKMIPGFPQPTFTSVQDGFDPLTAVPHMVLVEEVALEDLLQRVVMTIGERDVTVKDAIRQVAHVSGAVHAGAPRQEIEHAMASVSDSLQIGGFDPVIRTLCAVGRVVVRALTPLRDEILAGR
jgi:hypothetical protein